MQSNGCLVSRNPYIVCHHFEKKRKDSRIMYVVPIESAWKGKFNHTKNSKWTYRLLEIMRQDMAVKIVM